VQVVDAELEALQVRLRTMAGEMAAKADAVVVTKIADTVDDNVQRCVPMEWLQGGREGRVEWRVCVYLGCACVDD
jgi:hypothetical protein